MNDFDSDPACRNTGGNIRRFTEPIIDDPHRGGGGQKPGLYQFCSVTGISARESPRSTHRLRSSHIRTLASDDRTVTVGSTHRTDVFFQMLPFARANQNLRLADRPRSGYAVAAIPHEFLDLVTERIEPQGLQIKITVGLPKDAAHLAARADLNVGFRSPFRRHGFIEKLKQAGVMSQRVFGRIRPRTT